MAYKPIFSAPRSTEPQGDYLNNASPDTILNDPRFQKEYREMRKRQWDGEDADSWSVDELIEDFYTHQTYINNNSVSAAADYYRAGTSGDQQTSRMARIQRAYEMAPTRGIDSVDAWQDWAGATLLDPLNAIGVGAGAKAGFQATRAGASVGRAALQGAKRGAAAGAVEGAATEGVIDSIVQNRNIETGLQDEFSYGRLATQAGVGAAFGGGIGSALGAGGAAAFRGRDAGLVQALTRAGVPEEVMQTLDASKAKQLLEQLGGGTYEDAANRAAPSQGATEGVTPVEPEEAKDEFDISVFTQAKQAAEAELDELQNDGAPQSTVRKAEANVARMTELLRINELVANTRANTYRMLESDDSAVRGKANENLGKVLRLESLARRLQKDPTLAQIQSAAEEAEEIVKSITLVEREPADFTSRSGATAADIKVEDPNAPPAKTPEEIPTAPEGEAGPTTAEAALTPEATATEAAPEVKTGRSLVDIEADESAYEALDVAMEALAPIRGAATFRSSLEAVARGKFPEQADDVMRLYDQDFGNPNGLPKEVYETKVTAPKAASAAPQGKARAAKRRAAKKGKGAQAELKQVSDEMANKSLDEQLREMGLLGKLVKGEAMVRGESLPNATVAGVRANRAADANAELAARNRELTATGAPKAKKPQRSATGRAADELSMGAKTTGTNERGRPQDILKSGQATERDPVTGEATRTITDGTAPRRNELDREAFEMEATANRDIAEWTADQPMTGVIGGTTRNYKTNKGKSKSQTGYVPRGTKLYYSPFTSRYYTDQRDALAASGRGPARNFKTDDPSNLLRRPDEDFASRQEAGEASARAERDSLTDGMPTPEEIVGWTQQHLAGEIDTDEFLALIKGGNRRVVEAEGSPQERAVSSTPQLGGSEDLIPSIRNKETGSVRTLSARQEEMGLGIEALYGKSDPEKFDVGFVERGASGKKRTDTFRAASEEEIAGARASERGDIEDLPIDRAEAADLELDFPSMSAAEFEAYNNFAQRNGHKRVARDSKTSAMMLDNYIELGETISWSRLGTQTEIQSHINDLALLYQVRARTFPNGVKRTVQSKQEAKDAIDLVFTGQRPEDVVAAKAFLDRLAGTNAPVMNRTINDNSYTAFGMPKERNNGDNEVFLAMEGDHPMLTRLYHETAHWAYRNILTDADRAEFWAGVSQRFYDGDNLDADAVLSKSLLKQHGVSNGTLSPQEYFANQFAGFVTRGDSIIQDASFWNRMIGVVRNMFKRFAQQDFIDPELEPLFAKIIPQDEAEATFRLLKPSKATSKMGEAIVTNLNRANYLHDELGKTLRFNQPESAIAAAEDMADYLFKLSARNNTFSALGSQSLPSGKAGSKTGKVKMEKAVRDTAFRIAEILGRKVDEDALNGLGDLDDEIVDMADIWLRDNAPEGTTKVRSPEDIMEELRGFFGGKDRSIDQTVAYVSYTLNRAFKREEGYAFSPQQLPNAYRAGREYRNDSSLKKGVSKRAKRQETQAKDISKKAETTAKTPKHKRPNAARATAPVGASAANHRSMSMSELYTNYQTGDANMRDAASLEMLRRTKAEPSKEWAKAKISVSNEVKVARQDELQGYLQAAIDDGDPAKMQEILYEAWRRGESRRRKKNGLPPIRPVVDRMVESAVEREQQQSVGVFEEGITPGASTTVQEIQSFMSHRDPEVQNTMRTLVYRALNLKGKAVSSALDDTAILSVGDIYRLAGKDQPVGATGVFGDFRDAGFTSMRSNLRKMAIGLTKDVSDPFDVMHEVHHLALRTGIISPDELVVIRKQFVEAAKKGERVAQSRLRVEAGGRRVQDLSEPEIERLAEEWFAEQGAIFSMGKVAKGDLFAVREGRNSTALTARPHLITLANRMIDAAAYMVNGVMGRTSMKQMFRRIDGYGDMFAKNRNPFPPSKTGVAPEYAAAHYGDAMARMNPSRIERMKEFAGGIGVNNGKVRVFYHGTPSGDRMTSPDTVMQAGSGDYGRAIYLTSNQMVANDVYANRSTKTALTKRLDDHIKDGLIDPEARADLEDGIATLSSIRREISSLTKRRAFLGEEGGMNAVRREDVDSINQKIEDLRAYENYFIEELDAAGLNNSPHVLGTVVRADTPADFRRSARHTRESVLVSQLLDDLEANGAVDFRKAHFWHTSIPEVGFAGPELHRSLIDLLVKQGGARSVREATDTINESLGRLGYDSIHADLPNTLSSGEKVWHESVMLIDHVDRNTGQRVEAAKRVKSIDASDFDETSPQLYNSMISETPVPNQQIIHELLSGKEPNGEMLASVVDRMDATGAPPDMTRAIVGMARGRAPAYKKWFQSTKNFMSAAISANSTQLERAGMPSIAKWHREQHVDHGVAMGERVFTLRDVLETLPDTPDGFGRWLDVVKAPVPGKIGGGAGKIPVPKTHARIVSALRMGDTSDAYRALDATERAAADKIKGMLADELTNLRKAGVVVGRIENYFPQVWDVERLKVDPEGFVDKLANYFEAESGKIGTRMSRDDAIGKATTVWGRMVDSEGFHIPPPSGSSRTATSDNIDYQRLIRLDDPDFVANFKELEGYLVNDLEGSLIKYFDGTSRRILQTSRWGAMNHGYYDYLHVMAEGVGGIADLLSTNRVFRKDVKTVDEDGPFTVELRDETMMPFDGDDKASKIAAARVKTIYETEGVAAARQFLLSLDPNKPIRSDKFTNPTKSTYQHRVDAIIEALSDGQGKRGSVRMQDLTFAQDAMQSAIRKPVSRGPGTNEISRNTSRGLRTFNAVSLLSFTMLTSMTDFVLPMIKTGSVRKHIQGVQKYMNDPVYRRAIRNTGVAVESITHQRMAGLFATDVSGKLGRINNSFFNASLLTPWTDMQRSIAASTGFQAFSADVEKAILAMKGDGQDIAAQTPEFKRTIRRLKHYGISDYVYGKKMLTQQNLEEDVQLKKAIYQFANETIFAPNPDDMPLWTQTPWGSVMWQLKSYPVMLGRMAADIIGTAGGDVGRAFRNKDWAEIDPQNMKSLGYMFTLGPAMGAAVLGMKDIVQMRGGEENDEAEFRARNWKKFMGYSKEVHGDENTYAGWYAEGMMAMGGMGLLADILHTAAETSDSGAYGQNRTMGAIGGPSVGTLGSAVTVMGGVYDKDPDSNSNERAAWREAIRRVPFIGGVGSIRNNLVDSIAGEAGEDQGDEVERDFDYDEFAPEQEGMN